MAGKNYFAHKSPLWIDIESKLLPFVIKPGRYVGNELNTIIKDHGDRFKIALAFPDIYEIGMSYLGMQILYNIINSRDDCIAERVFQVWPDMENLMRKKDIPLFSLETSTPLREFDVLGISVTYEMHAAGVLTILDLADIPFRSIDRGDSYPLVIAGGPAIINPEPLADFFDAMVIGDGEEITGELIDCLISNKDKQKKLKLQELAKIQGVYVPSLYDIDYDGNLFKSVKPIRDDIPGTVKVRTCRDLKSDYYPSKPIVPFIETTHDRLAVEIMRGCVNGCRFCQAGYQYRPQRPRRASDIFSQIQDGYRATGHDDVTLLSLSSTDYPELEKMISGIMPFMKQNHISLSLPSLRPGSLSSRMLEYLKYQRKSGITFAPEGGTQRMRDVMGKYITSDEIYDGISKTFDNDWTLVKLYFMVGLPGETEDDINGIINTIKEASRIARNKGGRKNINVTISPFCPKPGTPWQWESQLDHNRAYMIFDKLSQAIRNRNVSLKMHDPKLAEIEGILGRGDRRFSGVIEKVYKAAARLDGWSEHFEYERWIKAFNDCGYKINDLLAVRFLNDPLPWDHIDKGLPKKFLLDDRERSLKGELPPGAEHRKEKQARNANQLEYGRSIKKRVIASATPIKSRIRLKYERHENIRFYSHLDILRMFMRALRRAALPVSFSQGFHPHMKLSFGPPLPIGYTSDAEYLDIQLDSPFDKGYLPRLNDCLPEGIEIVSSKLIYANVESLSKIINSATYSVELDAPDDHFESKIAELITSKKLNVKRIKKDQEKHLEVRQYLHELNYDQGRLDMLLGFTPEGYLRPSEVLIFGMGIPEQSVLPLIFKRTGQYLLQGVHKVDPFDLV